MKEPLISFETAKLAKEKGFDIPCNYYIYIPEALRKVNNSWKINKKDKDKFEENHIFSLLNKSHKGRLYNRNKYDTTISVPTQSLLQKWLREVHNIHMTIFSSSQESWMFRITKPHQKLEEGMYGEDYYSYEEALEIGLQEALELIKND